MENYSKPYNPVKEIVTVLEEAIGREYKSNEWGIGFAKTNIAQGHFGFTCVEMKVLGNFNTNELIVYRQIQNTVVGKIGVENFSALTDSLDGVNDIIVNTLMIKDKQLINTILTDVQNFQNWKASLSTKESSLKIA